MMFVGVDIAQAYHEYRKKIDYFESSYEKLNDVTKVFLRFHYTNHDIHVMCLFIYTL